MSKLYELIRRTSKSYKVVKDAVWDLLMPAKFAAFESIAKQLQPFLTVFQPDIPLLPFVCSQLEKIIIALTKRFMKTDVINKSSTSKLLQLDLTRTANCLEVSKVDVGFAASVNLRTLLSNKISDRQVYAFRSECLAFLRAVVGKLVMKTPLTYDFARNMGALDPNSIIQNQEGALKKFRGLLNKLVLLRRLKMQDCDTLLYQYSEFCDKTVQTEQNSFVEFNFKIDRVDSFLYKYVGKRDDLTKLWSIMKMLLILSHGQASVEMGF